MTTWKIKSEQVFENGEFKGTEFTANYYDQKGEPQTLSFRYAYYTNNFRGMVESVLHTVFKGTTPPKNVSNVRTSQ